MSAPTEAEVIDYVSALERDYNPFAMQGRIDADVYTLRRLPKLPKDLARQQAIYMLSPDVKKEAKDLVAFQLSMRTDLDAVPTEREPGSGLVPSNIKKMADELGTALGLVWVGLNPNREVDAADIWNQMVMPVGITVLEMGGIDSPHPHERFPWSMYDVPIEGCGWQESKGIPSIFGRHYKMLVGEIENEYSGKRGNGLDHEGPMQLKYHEGKWDFYPMSDSYSYRLAPMQSMGSKNVIPEADMMYLANGGWLTHVALNAPEKKFNIGVARFGPTNQRSGRIVYQCENPFGRVPVFLCSGTVTPLSDMTEKREPFLDELIITSQQESLNDSMIATAARNRAAGKNYVKVDPEELRDYRNRNQGKDPPDLVWKEGQVPWLAGEIMEVPNNVDPALSLLSDKLEARRNRYSNAAFTQLLDPQVVKDSTLGAWAGAFDASAQKLSVPTGYRDQKMRQVLECVENSVKWLAEKHGKAQAEFQLTGGADHLYTGGSQLKKGSSAYLNVDMLDFPHTITVQSRSNTLAQQMQLIQLAESGFVPLADGRPNVGTYADLMIARGEDDPTQRKSTMAVEALMAQYGGPYVQEAVKAAIDKRVELMTGAQIPLLLQPPAAVGPDGQPLPPGEAPPDAGQPPVGPQQDMAGVPPPPPGAGPQPPTPSAPVFGNGNSPLVAGAQ